MRQLPFPSPRSRLVRAVLMPGQGRDVGERRQCGRVHGGERGAVPTTVGKVVVVCGYGAWQQCQGRVRRLGSQGGDRDFQQQRMRERERERRGRGRGWGQRVH